MIREIYVVYPEERVVTSDEVITLAVNAYHSGVVDRMPDSFYDAVELLQQCGHQTVKESLH